MIIKTVALENGLDTEEMIKAISENRYKSALDETHKEGRKRRTEESVNHSEDTAFL